MHNYSLIQEVSIKDLLQIDLKCQELIEIKNHRKTIEIFWMEESDITPGNTLTKDDLERIHINDSVFIISLN
jgi:hypothetical protein